MDRGVPLGPRLRRVTLMVQCSAVAMLKLIFEQEIYMRLDTHTLGAGGKVGSKSVNLTQEHVHLHLFTKSPSSK